MAGYNATTGNALYNATTGKQCEGCCSPYLPCQSESVTITRFLMRYSDDKKYITTGFVGGGYAFTICVNDVTLWRKQATLGDPYNRYIVTTVDPYDPMRSIIYDQFALQVPLDYDGGIPDLEIRRDGNVITLAYSVYPTNNLYYDAYMLIQTVILNESGVSYSSEVATYEDSVTDYIDYNDNIYAVPIGVKEITISPGVYNLSMNRYWSVLLACEFRSKATGGLSFVDYIQSTIDLEDMSIYACVDDPQECVLKKNVTIGPLIQLMTSSSAAKVILDNPNSNDYIWYKIDDDYINWWHDSKFEWEEANTAPNISHYAYISSSNTLWFYSLYNNYKVDLSNGSTTIYDSDDLSESGSDSAHVVGTYDDSGSARLRILGDSIEEHISPSNFSNRVTFTNPVVRRTNCEEIAENVFILNYTAANCFSDGTYGIGSDLYTTTVDVSTFTHVIDFSDIEDEWDYVYVNPSDIP